MSLTTRAVGATPRPPPHRIRPAGHHSDRTGADGVDVRSDDAHASSGAPDVTRPWGLV